MPRTKLSQPRFPPINNLRAAILERKFVGRLTWAEIGAAAHISGDVMRKYATTKDPEEWPRDVRNQVCRFLEIRVTTTVTGEHDGTV